VGPWGATGHNDAVELLLLHRALNARQKIDGAYPFALFGVDNALLLAGLFHDGRHIDGGSNVAAAVADENADPVGFI
jgi:hypothetical protein